MAPTAMKPHVLALPTLSDLLAFVHAELCRSDRLDPEQAPLKRSPLLRGGRPCGLMFHVEGPRLLRTSAVWAADENRILFYDSTGVRAKEVRLSESPDVAARTEKAA
jgi:hypothetical protein